MNIDLVWSVQYLEYASQLFTTLVGSSAAHVNMNDLLIYRLSVANVSGPAFTYGDFQCKVYTEWMPTQLQLIVLLGN